MQPDGTATEHIQNRKVTLPNRELNGQLHYSKSNIKEHIKYYYLDLKGQLQYSKCTLTEQLHQTCSTNLFLSAGKVLNNNFT